MKMNNRKYGVLKEQTGVLATVILAHILIALAMPEVRKMPHYVSFTLITGTVCWLWAVGLTIGFRYLRNKHKDE